MTVALSSQRAMHAIRLVMRDYKPPPPTQRGFSVAVLPHYPSSTRSVPLPSASSTSDTWNLRHASSDVPTSDFLETPSSPEYTSAALTLPPRTFSTEHWATLYPSSYTSIFHPHAQSRRCDTLAHLAAAGELSVARTVYDELRALHIGIQRRAIYLSAALSALTSTDSGKAEFLFWLKLVPNRPAVRSHPGVKAVWDPVVDKLLADFSADRTFLSEFLYLSARKGILPTVLPRMVRHLALITPLPEIQRMMNDLEKVYLAGTTSRRSTSTRAEAHAVYAQLRVRDMRNAFVRALSGAGWIEAAEDMLGASEGWTEDTVAYVQARKEGMMPKPPPPLRPIMTTLAQRVRHARDTRMSTKNLVELIDQLESRGRTGLVQLLERRMARIMDPSRREGWYHARLLLARQRGESSQVIVELFNQYFSWVGIPPTNLSLPPSTISTKLVASSALFTSLLPSLLPLLPAPLEFHASYITLSTTLSPRLRPTAGTHSAFVRQLTHLFGPSAGLEALRHMINAGLEPGLGVFEAVLWSMAGRGEWDSVQRLLGGMEKRVKMGEGMARMPYPEEKTYEGIVGILERAGLQIEAEQIRRKEVLGSALVKPRVAAIWEPAAADVSQKQVDYAHARLKFS